MQKLNRTQWKFIGWAVCLLALAAGLLMITGVNKHEGRAVLIINQENYAVDDDQSLTPIELAVTELSELQKTDSFIRLVISKSDLEADLASNDQDIRQMVVDVRKSIEILELDENNVEILVTWNDPTISEQLANAVSKSYAEWKAVAINDLE